MGYFITDSISASLFPRQILQRRISRRLKTATPANPGVESGLRVYSPVLARWVSRDPIGERGGFLLYGFVGNDPMGRWDYLGMNPTLESLMKDCLDLKRRLDERQRLPGDEDDDWWNQFINRRREYKVKVKCDACCLSDPWLELGITGVATGSRLFKTCDIRVCVDTRFYLGGGRAAIIDTFLHELTHCSQTWGGRNRQNNRCGVCICNEVQAYGRENHRGVTPDGNLVGRAIKSCAKQCEDAGQSPPAGEVLRWIRENYAAFVKSCKAGGYTHEIGTL